MPEVKLENRKEEIVNPHDAPDYDPTIDPTSSAYIPNDEGVFTINSPLVRVNGLHIVVGSGSPQNVVPAPLGSMYLNRSGGTSVSLYMKETEVTKGDKTGWIAK